MATNLHLLTFEGAYHALRSTNQLDFSKHTIDNLDRFLESRVTQLQRCYNHIPSSSIESAKTLRDYPIKDNTESSLLSENEKTLKDQAFELRKLLDIDELESLNIVLRTADQGLMNDEKRKFDWTRLYFSERRYAIRLVNHLFKIKAELSRPSTIESGEADQISVFALAKKHSVEILANSSFFSNLIKYISSLFRNFPGLKDESDESISGLYNGEMLYLLMDLLELLFTSLYTEIPSSSSDLLLDWINLMEETNAFSISSLLEENSNESSFIAVRNYETIVALCQIITISFLDLDQDFSVEGSIKSSYISNPQSLSYIHKILGMKFRDNSVISPILLAWSFVLHRVSLRLSDIMPADAKFKVLYDTVEIEANDNEALAQLAGNLAAHAIRSGAYNRICDLIDTLPSPNKQYASVCSTLVQSSLPYVAMNDQLAKVIQKILSPYPDLAQSFFLDPFSEKALALCKAKVPIAITPFLRLCQCLRSGSFDYVSAMITYMQELSRNFRDYEFPIAEKSSVIELTSDLCLFAPRKVDNGGGVILTAGARGEIIPSESSSIMVMWDLEYNGWSFLGRVLEEAQLQSSYEGDLVKDIFILITNTLEDLGESQAIELLSMLSIGLEQGSDIIEVITKIIDECLYARDVEMSIIGINFLKVLTQVSPHRTWSYIGRTKLLERNGKGGLADIILSAVEIVDSKYDLTLSIIDLVSSLVDEALVRTLDFEISHKLKSENLGKFISHLVSVYESFAYWRYSSPRQKLQIGSKITAIFNRVLYSVFRTSDDNGSRITSVLLLSSTTIIDHFLSTSETAMRVLQPLFSFISSVYEIQSLPSEQIVVENEYAGSCLQLCALLVRIRSRLKLPVSALEKQLFILTPVLTGLFTRYFALHSIVIKLLSSMISAFYPDEEPSLLAHLGSYSQLLISGLAGALLNDMEADSAIAAICEMFDSIMKSKQEGLSILLLSGKETKNSLSKDKSDSKSSLLSVLEKKIVMHSLELPSRLTGKLLRSVSLSHSYWNMSKRHHAADSKLIDCVIDLLERSYIKFTEVNGDEKLTQVEFIELSEVYDMVANAFQLLSIELYKRSSDGSRKILESLKPKLVDYSTEFLVLRGFRPSLHGNLHRNFRKKWPKGSLDKFKTSDLLCEPGYGESYLYDLELLDLVYGDESVWEGYRKEVIEANVNWSFVDSQKLLINAWGSFLTSYVLTGDRKLKDDRATMQSMRTISYLAIDNNIKDGVSYPYLLEIFSSRLNLVFFLMYHLSDAKMLVTDGSVSQFEKMFNLLPTGDSSDPRLYQQLLKIINLCLNDFVDDKSKSSFQLIQLVQGILDLVVIKGMKHAAASARNGDFTTIEDMIQITMILRKCLRVKGVSTTFGNLVTLMMEHETDRAAMSLFSYSLELGDIDDEPSPFGELSLLYLLEWLPVDVMADHFVSNGLLQMLIESPASKIIQQEEIGPLANPRLHSMWTNGILTIMLVMLQQLGTRIIPEVLAFLQYFQNQIYFALNSWIAERSPSSRSIITLSTVTESSQLALLLDIVTKLCERDQVGQIPQFPDKAEVAEAIDYLLSHHKYLASRVMLTSQEEQKLVSGDVALEDYKKIVIESIINELTELRDFLISDEK